MIVLVSSMEFLFPQFFAWCIPTFIHLNDFFALVSHILLCVENAVTCVNATHFMNHLRESKMA